jgi:hypothetical protein
VSRELTDLEQDLVQKGLNAETLLTNPLFNEIVSQVHRDCFEAFVATKVGEMEKREDAYKLAQGMTMLVNYLSAAVSTKDGIEEAIQNENNEER